MNSSAPTLPDKRNYECKNVQILSNGTRITSYEESQKFPDGSFLTKTRIARTFPSEEGLDSYPVTKEIETTITRMDPDGSVRTTTTTKETITAPDISAEANTSPSETQLCVLPDGSQVLANKSSSKLADGSLSTVITEVRMNRVDGEPCSQESHDHNQRPSSEISAPRSRVRSDNQAGISAQCEDDKSTNIPCIDFLPPSNPPLPPGYTRSRHVNDNERKLKLQTVATGSDKSVHKSQNPTFLETIDHDASAIIPPQYKATKGVSLPGVKKVLYSLPNGDDEYKRKEDISHEKKIYGIETISHGFREPVPRAAATHEKQNFNTNGNTIQYIDSSCDERIPITYFPANTARQSTVMTLEIDDNAGHRDPTKMSALDVASKQNKDSCETVSPHDVGLWELSKETADSRITRLMSDRSHGLDPTPKNDKLAVATAIDAFAEEGPIYEASDFIADSNTRIYRNRIRAAMTFTLLLLIGAGVSVAVVYTTNTARQKAFQNAAYGPTVSPTSQRYATMTQVLETNVLKRNVTFSDMTHSDPPILALDWVLHQDDMHLDAKDPKVTQRFTLALLGFHFDYLAWDNYRNSSDDSYDWLTETDECEWFGVSCLDGEITSLNLTSNSLIGYIPPEIGNLLKLEQLILSENCLFGTLPSEMVLLSNLQHIELQSNGLSGSVANEFYNLSSLAYLDLATQKYNDFNCTSSNGIIIEAYYKMGDSGNEPNIGLEGTFLEKIGDLQHLEYLDLSENSFSGSVAQEIWYLENLQTFGAYDNHLYGTIPEEMWTMSNLRDMWIMENNFSGTLPGSISGATSLETLYAGSNNFNGTIPETISRLSKLRVLGLEENNFSGPLPTSIGEAKALERLWLDDNGKMNGTIPDSLYNLTQLGKLDLSGNAFDGVIKAQIGNLKNLTELGLAHNKFTGTLPSELGLCENLVLIQFHRTNIEGRIPPEVCLLRTKSSSELTSDCLSPKNGTPFIECDESCCTMCCVHDSTECLMMD